MYPHQFDMDEGFDSHLRKTTLIYHQQDISAAQFRYNIFQFRYNNINNDEIAHHGNLPVGTNCPVEEMNLSMFISLIHPVAACPL